MIVYRLISPSGKSYVGQSVSHPEKRMRQHVQEWKRWIKKDRPRRYNCTKLYYAFDTYAPEEWTHEVLFETDDVVSLNEAEVRLIAEHDTVENGYNIMLGGQQGWKGLKLDEDHKKAQSEARKAYWLTPEGIAWKAELSRRLKEKNPGGEACRGKSSWNKGIKNTWSAAASQQTYEVTHPDERIEIVTNLSEFARSLGFDPVNFNSNATKLNRSYKGYKARKIQKT